MRNVVLLRVDVRGVKAQAAGRRLKRLASRFMRTLKLEGVELSLSLVTDAAIRRINKEWRQKDKATDVLSFPAGDSIAPGLKPLGDVIISLETAERMAVELGTTATHEQALYLAHGLLHLLGHDHHRPAETKRMRALEAKLLGREGMLGRAS